MTVRLTELGGTDWEDLEVLDAVDLNDTIKATITHVEEFTAVGPFTHTGDTDFWSDDTEGQMKFTLSNPAGAKILGIRCFLTLQSSDGDDTAEVQLRLGDSTVQYFKKTPKSNDVATVQLVDFTSGATTLFDVLGSGAIVLGLEGNPWYTCTDANLPLTFYIKISPDTSETVTLSAITLKVWYVGKVST